MMFNDSNTSYKVTKISIFGISIFGWIEIFLDRYDASEDVKLIQLKNKLIAENSNPFDTVFINNLRRSNIHTMYRWDYLNRYFRYNQGYITTWYDADTKKRCRALVRSDGKILTDICERKPYRDGTMLTARVVDGYVVGIADNVSIPERENIQSISSKIKIIYFLPCIGM
jgi:hypothetical protein